MPSENNLCVVVVSISVYDIFDVIPDVLRGIIPKDGH
jgi:hypothetical protein